MTDPSNTPSQYDIRLDLPVEWALHEPDTWAGLATEASLSPALRSVLSALDAPHATQPAVVASLLCDIRIEEDDAHVVLMASLVLSVLSTGESVTASHPNGYIRRGVPLVDGVHADFFELSILVADASAGLLALATFTTPNLPLVQDMEPGFRAIADTIRFVRSDAELSTMDEVDA